MMEASMDMAERYCERTKLLLRLIDPEDLGHLVDAEARREISRVLRLLPPATPYTPPVSQFAEATAEERE